MSWRTVVITQRAKLDMKNGYLVVRTEDELCALPKTSRKIRFIMMQESVYCRLSLNQTAARIVADQIRGHMPPEGLVQVL